MELPFAGLHQFCAPILDGLAGLPVPQQEALRVAFGGKTAPPRTASAALAVLSLLAAAAEERPLVCLIDDAQWLDRATAQALAFVARRLLAERIAMLFALREPSDDVELDGLPEFVVEGIADDHARELLASELPGRLDDRVRDRIVAETRGNPLALIELPRGLTAAELAGGFGFPDPGHLAGRIEQTFQQRVDSLPAESQRLLLTAAAEPIGDVTLIWRAAERLGIAGGAVAPAEGAGLIELGTRVRFRHPLVRSAVYRAAPLKARQEVHRALAEVTNQETDPDGRAWHRAHATAGLDESVAEELELSADRAHSRGGAAAAAAFLERAAELTPDPARRGLRTLAAARAKLDAGAPNAASALLTPPDRARSTTSREREWREGAPASRSPHEAVATHSRCWLRLRTDWFPSMSTSPATHISKRSRPPSLPAASATTRASWRWQRQPASRRRRPDPRGPRICSWTGWRPVSRRATLRRRPGCRRRCKPFAGVPETTRMPTAGSGLPARSRRTFGTTPDGTNWPRAVNDLRVNQGPSTTFRSPLRTAPAFTSMRVNTPRRRRC